MKYKVIFSYSVEVEGINKSEAEDKAWHLFGQADPTNNDQFSCVVSDIDLVWDTNSYGEYTCVDCMDSVPESKVLGNKEHGEPRCEGCYDRYKHGA